MALQIIQDIIKENNITDKSGLLKLLQALQEQTGLIQYQHINEISKILDIPESKIFSIASFYNYFRFSAKGQFHIEICTGTACYINDCDELTEEIFRLTGLQNGETSKNGLISIEHTGCLGGCAQGPILKINNTYYSKINTKKLKAIIEKIMQGEMPLETID